MDILALASKMKELGVKARPAVLLEQIKELEAQAGIKLPEDYALFITQVGDGWDKRVDELLRPKHFGNIFLMRGRNGEKFHLILNGECSGEVWMFTDIGVAPCSPRVTFSEWIASWLESKTDGKA